MNFQGNSVKSCAKQCLTVDNVGVEINLNGRLKELLGNLLFIHYCRTACRCLNKCSGLSWTPEVDFRAYHFALLLRQYERLGHLGSSQPVSTLLTPRTTVTKPQATNIEKEKRRNHGQCERKKS